MPNLFLLECSPRVFIFFLSLKKLLKTFFFIVFLSGRFFANDISIEDTLIIHPISFNTPSPEGWVAQYKATIDFPDEEWSWRKILMVQTLKCDPATKGDKYDCGEWDYIWDALLHVPKEDTIEVFKLGSFVTPYGKRLVMGGVNGWQWIYDITDYAPLLKGKRNLHIGNNQELLDLKFYFISGTPFRDQMSVKNIYPLGEYDGHYGYTYKYGDISNNNVLKTKQIDLDPLASGFSIKAIISGHGHEGPKYCCEWVNKSHSYVINGLKEFTWNVWKDCGNNPIYPQGGTWPYDRAGWCPGTKVDEYVFELTDLVNPGQTISIDYEIEKMIDEKENKGIYRMSHQLFSFGPPNFKRNLEIVDIINPSSKDQYSRINPTLSSSRVIVKNIGSEEVRRIKFIYGLESGKRAIYRWRGSIKFLEKLTIELPINDWSGLNADQRFFIQAFSLNGREDESPVDNILFTQVRIPRTLPSEFLLKLTTNNLDRAKQNTYQIRDYYGNILYSEYMFLDTTAYDNKISLDPGLYQFVFTDANEDGIDRLWWQEKDSVGVSGKLGLYNLDQSTIQEFTPDFGQEIRMDFIVGPIP